MVRSSAVGAAPIRDSVAVLNAITSGWSISYTVVPAGQESRYGRASSPDATMTTWRRPALPAAAK